MSHHQIYRKDENGDYRWFDACAKRDIIIQDTPVAIGGKSQISKSLGVAPPYIEQRNKLFETNRIAGARQLPDGTLYMKDRQTRNEVLKALGHQDNDAGYGDWAGGG